MRRPLAAADGENADCKEPAFAADLRKSIAAWTPPAALLDDDEPANLEKIAKQHAPLETLSFTSILRKLTASRSAIENT